MFHRLLRDKLMRSLQTAASVVLIGPRQVGKTTLCFRLTEEHTAIYLDLENKVDLLKVSEIADFATLHKDKLIILDEIQRSPELFQEIRGIIDERRRGGQKTGIFLFLGSASIDLLKQSSESLAGRISILELFPFNLLEFADLKQLWVRGGFPESVLSENMSSSLEWRQDFIRTYLERDIPQLGPRIPSETLSRFWTMLAHAQGSELNASKLAANLDVKSPTVARYLDLMVDLLLVRRLPPYFKNVKKRLIKSPRVYVRDSGLCHALLGIEKLDDLLGHPVVGKSWEGFVIENVASVIKKDTTLYFYKTSGGAEIDLVIEKPSKLWAVEIKKSASASLSRGFYEAAKDLEPHRKFVVHSTEEQFMQAHGTESMGLKDFLVALQREF